MQDPIKALSTAKCIHGIDHTSTLIKMNGGKRVTEVSCSICQVMLYSCEFDPVTLERKRFYHDEVYELLYTRRGRLRLLMRLMKDRGLTIPGCWEYTLED